MPSIKLTEKSVERLPFSDVAVYYYDTRLIGFGVRVGKRTKTYFVQGRAAGKNFRPPLGKVGAIEFSEAYEKADKILKDAARGIYPVLKAEAPEPPAPEPPPAKVLSLRTMLSEYLAARKKLKDRTRSDYLEVLERYLPDWMDLPMSSITPTMAQKKHEELGTVSPAGADYAFRVVRALYNYAMAVYDEEITRNPALRLSVVRAWYQVPRRKTFVKAVQLPTFFTCLRNNPGMLADYLELLLFTGIRSASEIATLEVSQVDLRERSIHLPDTKHDDLHVPVSASALAVLKRRVKEATATGKKFVFFANTKKGYLNSRSDKVRSKIKAIFQDTDLEKFTPHDLRRSFLTYADELQIGNAVQKRLVGHAVSDDVTDGYKVLTLERLRKVVTRIERYILKHGKITAAKTGTSSDSNQASS